MKACGSIILFSIFIVLPAMDEALMDINDLYTDLLIDSYKKNLSPSVLGNQVGVLFRLLNLFKFDEVSGLLGMSGMFEMYWNDTRLTWDPMMYDYEYQILLPDTSVWVPEISPLKHYEKSSSPASYSNKVRYYSTGECHYMKSDVYYGQCSTDYTNYPYDTQTCTMTFVPWGYYKEEIEIVSLEDVADLEYYSTNSVWEVVSTKTFSRDLMDPEGSESATSVYEIEITLKRRSSFYLLYIILPLVLMEVLHLFVFILPHESGERLSYSATVLLAVAVYMTIVTSYVPTSSDSQIPSIVLKTFFDLVICCWIQICVIINARVYNNEKESPKSSIIQSFGKSCLCCLSEDDKDDYSASWADVGRTMDIFFGLVSLALIVVSNVYFALSIF